MKVASDSTRITGFVRFSGAEFETRLPLVPVGSRELLFPHKAEDDHYFTGVALVNSAGQATRWTLRLYDAAGAQLARSDGSIAAGGRISATLRQLVGGSRSLKGGYFTVSSALPLIGYGVFGTSDAKALAAIPAVNVEVPETVGAAPEENYATVLSDSDFDPPRGGVAGGPGPAMFRLMVARSTDGLQFERSGKIVTDQGAVPDLVVDKDGVAYLYYTGWTVGRDTNKTVVAISKDGGRSWSFKRLEIERRQGESDLVDPDVLILSDGTFRLYTTIGGQAGYPRTYYSDSRDGIHFVRKGVAFDPGRQALDPSTIRIGDVYHLFAGGADDPQVNWHGISPDGAVYLLHGKLSFVFGGFGQMMANGLAVDGGYRFYCFGNDRRGGITSFFTADGATWTADTGYRLAADDRSLLESGQPTDPAVARLADGTYLMVYSSQIRR